MNVVASEKSHGNDKLLSKQLENCIVLQNSLGSRGEVHGDRANFSLRQKRITEYDGE